MFYRIGLTTERVADIANGDEPNMLPINVQQEQPASTPFVKSWKWLSAYGLVPNVIMHFIDHIHNKKNQNQFCPVLTENWLGWCSYEHLILKSYEGSTVLLACTCTAA